MIGLIGHKHSVFKAVSLISSIVTRHQSEINLAAQHNYLSAGESFTFNPPRYTLGKLTEIRFQEK